MPARRCATGRWPPLARAAVLAACALLAGAPGRAAEAPAGPVDIELRKSFPKLLRGRGRQPIPRAGQDGQGGRGAQGAPDTGVTTDSPTGASPAAGGRDAAVAAALGEPLAVVGTLHLPLPDGRKIVLETGRTPVVDTAAGRHVIIDAEARIGAGDAAAIERSWPGYAVVRPAPGAGLREVIGDVLAVAGYESVARATPLVFGRGATVRMTPDFVVQREAADLLAGELRAISVVEAADALPPELRELAAEHRLRIVELTADGRPAGPDRAPWRDPAGRVTTIETRSLTPLLAELGEALGLAADPAAEAPSTDIPLSDGTARDPALAAVGALLERAGVPAIGPTVDLYRVLATGARGRFVISVPGWLAEHGGRRLLITGASPPLPLRLYLTREGIDLFEYRLR